MKSDETPCSCGLAENPKSVALLIRTFGIPEDQVPRERHRARIRKQLEWKRAIAAGVVVGLLPVSALIYPEIVGQMTFLNAVAALAAVFAIFGMFCLVFRCIESRKTL